jgi:cysteine desulfurase
MGADPVLVRGGVRVSLGWTTTEADVDRFLEAWNVLARALLKERNGIAA